MSETVWTVGHSNHPIEKFLALLAGHSIELVADVRRFPASRTHPQFNAQPLAESLAAAGIGYRHFPGLGGRRKERLDDSPNTAWRVEAFNAYADHTQSAEFRPAWDELVALARERRVALMCAEALPWRCHRRILADAFVALGWTVLDIMPAGQTRPHELPPFARVLAGPGHVPRRHARFKGWLTLRPPIQAVDPRQLGVDVGPFVERQPAGESARSAPARNRGIWGRCASRGTADWPTGDGTAPRR